MQQLVAQIQSLLIGLTMLENYRKNTRVESTPLSRFVNGTPPKVKKRIYKKVLMMATEAQKKVLVKAKVSP